VEVSGRIGSHAIDARIRIDKNQIRRDRPAAGNRSDQIGAFSPERKGSSRQRSRDPNKVPQVVPVLQLTMPVEANETKVHQAIRQGGQFQVGDRACQCPAVLFLGIDTVLAVSLQHSNTVTIAADSFTGGVLLLTEFIAKGVGVDRCEPV